MTDQSHSAPSPEVDITPLVGELSRYKDLIATLRPANKEAMCASLAGVGITEIVVAFDGAGDEGQIDSIEAYTGDKTVAMPNETITFVCAIKGQTEPDQRVMTLREAIEWLVYDALDETHSGWEINDGAYGEFILDVEARVLTLDYSERYMAIQHYDHEF